MTILQDRTSSRFPSAGRSNDLGFGAHAVKNEVLLVSRVLMVALFVLFGWAKLTGYAVTARHFAQTGVPLPGLAAVIAVVMEFFVGLALAFGALTRPLAVLMAIYTFGTAILGHHFWTMTGPARIASEINFFKNVSIIGGFLLLYLSGAGRYSLDARLGLA